MITIKELREIIDSYDDDAGIVIAVYSEKDAKVTEVVGVSDYDGALMLGVEVK